MKHEKRYKSTGKVPNRLKKFRIAPYLEILLGLGLLAALGWAVWTYGVPFLRNVSAHAYSCKAPEATPSPTPEPTPEPTRDPYPDHMLYDADLKAMQTEIVVPEFQYAADVSIFEDTLVAAAGNYTPDGTAAFVRALLYDLNTKKTQLLPLPLQYKSIRFPALNERWIVYLDATANGGGRMMVYDRNAKAGRELKTVHTGLPRPMVWNDVAAWIERTGQSRDKLFLTDLNTGESVTVAIFDNSPYGMSDPYLFEGVLLYVAPDGALTKLDLLTGQSETVPTNGYVHDPQMNRDGVAYLDSNHGKDGRLWFDDGSGPKEIIQGAVSFAMGDGFIAYSRYEKNYVYYYGDGTTFCTTRSDETAMLLTAGGKTLVWMDVTWRDKDIIEWMTVGE